MNRGGPHTLAPQTLPDVSATLWKDMLLNLLVVLLLSVGDPGLPVDARAGMRAPASANESPQVHLYLDTAGRMRLVGPEGEAAVSRTALGGELREAAGAGGRLVVHHRQDTPAGAVYHALRAADGLFPEPPLVVLEDRNRGGDQS